MEEGATMEASQGNSGHVRMEPRLATQSSSGIIGKGVCWKAPCVEGICIYIAADGTQTAPPFLRHQGNPQGWQRSVVSPFLLHRCSKEDLPDQASGNTTTFPFT